MLLPHILQLVQPSLVPAGCQLPRELAEETEHISCRLSFVKEESVLGYMS